MSQWREEILGDGQVREWPIRALSTFSFNDHVATLTQADEIGDRISRFGCCECSERNDVVHGNARPYDFKAPLTRSLVTINSARSGIIPCLSSISGDTSNIILSLGAGLVRGLKFSVAFFAAKASAGYRSILACDPWFELKTTSTLSAFMLLTFNSIRRYMAVSEGIRRLATGAPFVTELVVVWHMPNRHMPLPPTALAAKSSCFFPVRLNTEPNTADFAFLFNHMLFVSQTTGIAKNNIDMFIDRPAPPKQEAML